MGWVVRQAWIGSAAWRFARRRGWRSALSLPGGRRAAGMWWVVRRAWIGSVAWRFARRRGRRSAPSLPGGRRAAGCGGSSVGRGSVPSPDATLGDGDGAAHRPYLGAGGRPDVVGGASGVVRFRRLALRSATGTAQRAVPTWGPAGGRDGVGRPSGVVRFRRLTLRSATGTAQRTVPTWGPAAGRMWWVVRRAWIGSVA